MEWRRAFDVEPPLGDRVLIGHFDDMVRIARYIGRRHGKMQFQWPNMTILEATDNWYWMPLPVKPGRFK